MHKTISNYLLRNIAAAIITLIVLIPNASADPNKVVDGVAIYLGVLPAEMILGYTKGQSEATMHGGVPQGKNRYHVMVALFDATTGKRITSAQVKATVAQVGMGGEIKPLEPMRIANTESFGNWFTMPGNGVYRIHLEIGGIKEHAKIATDLDYMRP